MATIAAAAACSYAYATALFIFIIAEHILHAAGLLVQRLCGGVPGSLAGQIEYSQHSPDLLSLIVLHLRGECGSTDQAPSSPDSGLLPVLLDCWINVLLYSNPAYHYQERSSLWRGARGGSTHSFQLLGYASMQMVGAGITFGTTVCTGILTALVSAISALSSYLVWEVGTTLVFSLLYIVQENYSDLLVNAVDQWNAAYGPLLHKVMFVPLQAGDVMFSSLVPLYNSGIWLARTLLHDVALDALIVNVPSIKQLGTSVTSIVRSF
jgi:hypothetical protein